MISSTSAKGIGHMIANKGRGNIKISERSSEAPVMLFLSSSLVASLLKTGFVTMSGIGVAFVRSTARVSGGFSRKSAGQSVSEVAEYLQNTLFFVKEKVYKNIEAHTKSGFVINTVCIYP